MTDIILVGASTRAAAMSARRAGWTPWCADLFADADLQRIATVRKVPLDAYPHGLLAALAHAPPGPVLYGGALENRPDLIARIQRPLWGNPPEVLRGVRTPSRWAHCLQIRGIPCPAIAETPTTAGRWLWKARKSAGGLGIQAYASQPFHPRTHFLQERIDGQACAAIYLGNNEDAILLGVTQQLIGTPWLHASGFHYAGNLGPLPLDAATASRWHALGAALAQTFHLRGLFGVDAIVRDGVPWPVEINPRYTASVEVLERSGKVSLLAAHRAVFEPEIAIPGLKRKRKTSVPFAYASGSDDLAPSICGKAILYARETLAFPQDGPWLAALQDDVDLDAVEYADIPHPGEIIEQGRPVLTLFASGPTVADCETNLREKAAALDRCLWG